VGQWFVMVPKENKRNVLSAKSLSLVKAPSALPIESHVIAMVSVAGGTHATVFA
jgi:hypothetical protein